MPPHPASTTAIATPNLKATPVEQKATTISSEKKLSSHSSGLTWLPVQLLTHSPQDLPTFRRNGLARDYIYGSVFSRHRVLRPPTILSSSSIDASSSTIPYISHEIPEHCYYYSSSVAHVNLLAHDLFVMMREPSTTVATRMRELTQEKLPIEKKDFSYSKGGAVAILAFPAKRVYVPSKRRTEKYLVMTAQLGVNYARMEVEVQPPIGWAVDVFHRTHLTSQS
ncbi:hypothetical protein PC114_g16211 [Phytophthora cactorum]|nr:hypothetical protein PC114_g16211 [Phytophthora cactorum]